MRRIFLSAVTLFVLLSIVTGLLYPLAVTGLANLLFPGTAQGSLVSRRGIIVGSALLAQGTSNPAYYWPRPSASGYNTLPSGASNLGPTSKALRTQMVDRLRQWVAENGAGSSAPPEMLSASGSGLDPHISPEAAASQLPRIARVRRWNPGQLEDARRTLNKHTEPPLFGFIGQQRVNILLLNLSLDGI